MFKKYIAIVLLVLALCVLTGCGAKTAEPAKPAYPGLEKLVEETQKLATNYNSVAEKAITNGWEYDDETVEELDKIATVIETINAGVVAPETFKSGEIEDYTKQAKELSKELSTIAKKVEDEYEIEGMTSTDGKSE